jgi:TonB-dependent receptor
LVTAASLDLLMVAGPATAQESSSAAEIGEITVTGFRASLAEALNRKRESNQILEAVSAEDIAKFPDQNIAEALQRLPGVQIDRENGQGTKVRIRGLDQNVTLLNEEIFQSGLELYTLGEGNFRNTDSLEGIPSELLGGVDVFKSPTAAQVEGGLGGIVNLRTRSPFALSGTTIAGNVRFAESTESRESWEPLGALLFGHEFSERAAVMATVSYDKQTLNTDVLGGDNRGNWRFSNRGDRAAVPQDYFAPEYRYTTDRDEERERLGGSLSFAFRPSESTEIQADWFHSDLEILTSEASLKFPFTVESPGLDTTLPFEIDENGVLISGTMIANSAEAISFVKNTDITADNFQLAFKFDDGGALRGRVLAAYSEADQESGSANSDVRYTRYTVRNGTDAGVVPNAAAPANYRFFYDNNGGTLPSFTMVGNEDLYTNPANGFFKSHWAFADTTEVENWAVRGDLEFNPPFIEDEGVVFSGGLRLAERNVEYEFGRYLADYSGSGELDGSQFNQNWTPFGYFQDGAIGYKSCEIPASEGANFQFAPCARFGNSPALITPYETFPAVGGRVESITDFWDSGTVAGNSVLVQDRSQMENAAAWIQALYPNTPFAFFTQPLESFQVEEQTTSGYLMADMGQPGDNYHVNVGVRLIHTELTVDQNAALPNPRFFGTDSWNGVLADFETVAHKRSYDDILPSANVVLDVTDQSKVRASAARVVARQPLFDLGRGFATDFTRESDPTSPFVDLFRFTSGSAGNPELDPFRASQFDLGYEYYFGRQGLVSVTGFWKEVDSFITLETQPEFVMDQAGGREGPVTRPVNGGGGYIRGFEVGGQMAFDWGGGFAVNYTYSDSESPTFNDVDSNLPIPGVAENAFNAQIYYENYGFQGRLSYSWRDKSFDSNFGFADATFSGTTQTNITRTYGVWNRDYGQLDGQIGYQVSKNFLITVEAINITEEDFSQYLQYENLPFTYSSGSMRILVGVQANF